MIIDNKILNYIKVKCKDEFDPFYLYDSQKIRSHCQLFRNIPYQNKAIHFASMANVNPHFLQIVKEEKVNVFVNSILHLEAAYEAGFRADEIIFTASALSKKIMKHVERYEVQLNIDSPRQLEQWLSLFPDKAIGIRCNIGDKVIPHANHAGCFIGRESRLGFTREEIDRITDKSKIKGLHLYAGTDIFDIGYLIGCYKELLDIAEDFHALEYLNFGGGFGVSEYGENHFNISEFGSLVTELMEEVSRKKGKSLRLILEPGRIIGCTAGYFVCHVTDVKRREDKNLVGVNASAVQFSRSLLYPGITAHPVMIIRDGKQLLSTEIISTTIYGCSTYSRDIFSDKNELPELKIGDIVIFGNAGSYLASSHLEFLGFNKPGEIFI